MHKVHLKGSQLFCGKRVSGPMCGSIPNIAVGGKVEKALMTKNVADVTCKRCLEIIRKKHGSK